MHIGRRRALPTDRDILRRIYLMYEHQYPTSTIGNVVTKNDPHLAIDIEAIAEAIRCKPELLFGRLYYHLDRKHRYQQDGGAFVHLFHLNFPGKGHAVNFPYLAAVLAGHDDEHRKYSISMFFSAIAITLSLASLIFGLLTNS